MRKKYFIMIILVIVLFSINLLSIELETSFNIVFDAELNSNIDGVVQHVAIDNPTRFLTNINQTNFSLSSNIINEKDKQLKSVLEFDFMGDNGFEIVSAYFYYKTHNLFFQAGKLENLVATTEKSLDYDGYYSTAGIQTGVLANQRQLQLGVYINDLILSFAITDELPSAGGIDESDYFLRIPAIEFSIKFNNSFMDTKFATHYANILLNNDDKFTTFIIMNETNLNYKNLKFKFSGFYSNAGSQFFVVDEMIDFYYFDNKVKTEKNFGGFSQLIYDMGKGSLWIGTGGFFTNNNSEKELKQLGYDFLKSNIRFSAGFEYEFIKNTIIAFEYSRFITKRLEGTNINRYNGNSFHLQLSIEF